MKRVFHDCLCWVLVLAMAGLPALAATAGVVGDHAGHAHSHDHVHGDHHDPQHDDGHPHKISDSAHAGGMTQHADCMDAACPSSCLACSNCLSSCSACSHCQGMPSITGMNFLTPMAQAMSLHSFQGGPLAAVLY